jgi:DNA mismatch repair protein MutL
MLRVVGQFATSYIIAEGPDGLYLIDQHAAHERILFDKFLAQQTEEHIEVQGLLDPLTLELSPRQKQLFDSRKEMLTQFGFQMEPFGDRTLLLRGIPALLKAEAAARVVIEILDSADEGSPLAERERRVAMSVACHSAIKVGQILSLQELQGLVRELEQTTSPRTCPHGRPTMIHLSTGQLAREFGRR